MDTSNLPDADKVDMLKTQVSNFLRYSWRKCCLYFWLNVAIVLTGIVLGSSITLVSAFGYSHLAAVFGAAIACLLSIQGTFKFAENARLWETKHNEAKEVRDRLRYKVDTEDDFQLVVDAWFKLKNELLEQMPRSEDLKPVKQKSEGGSNDGEPKSDA
jgi:hypothetical protein